MKIRIVREGFESYSVERQEEDGVWELLVPSGIGIHTPYEALAAARDERDYQIAQKCNRMGIGDSMEVEI